MRQFTFWLFLFSVSQVFFVRPSFCQDTNFVRVNTWRFENFGDSIPSWDVFRETYIGIAPTYGEASPFDQILYDQVHSKMINTGHCFGMSLGALQLLRYGGYDGFCAPASQYPRKYPNNEYKEPADARLQHAIQILQGHILNFRVISHLLDLITANNSRDGNFVYEQYKYYEAKKEYCIIGITESFFGVSASHALLPYHVTDDGAGNKKIYVYDVNRPFNKPGSGTIGHDWYIDRNNFIEIKSDGTWSYDMADCRLCSTCEDCNPNLPSPPIADLCPCPWSGSPSSDPEADTGSGHIFLMPLSIIGRKDRLPQSLFADAIEAVGKIFLFGQNAALEQISAPDGRHYFRPGTQELETSDSAALRCVLPFIPFNGGKPVDSDCQLYFVRGENDLDIAVRADECGYKVQLFSDYAAVTVTSDEAHVTEQIRIRGWNTPNPCVEVVGSCGSTDSRVEIQPLFEPGQ